MPLLFILLQKPSLYHLEHKKERGCRGVKRLNHFKEFFLAIDITLNVKLIKIHFLTNPTNKRQNEYLVFDRLGRAENHLK